MIKNTVKNLLSKCNSQGGHDVIIHIGAPKCGSSAIQRFCIQNRDALLKLGYFYPEHSLDTNGVSGGHYQFASALNTSDIEPAQTQFGLWLDEARSHNAILLLSAEAFYGQHAALARLCHGLSVKVIAFLRHPADSLLANHNQAIKRHMETRRLNELLPELLSRQTGHLSGLPLLQWANALGDEHCCFLPYQPPSAGGTPVEKLFLTALGLPARHVKKLTRRLSPVTNRSYVKSALELKRLLNTVLPELPPEYAHQTDWALQGYSDHAGHEPVVTLADFSANVQQQLEEQLLKQMAPVIERFPQLAGVANMPATNHIPAQKGVNLYAPLAVLQQEAPALLAELRKAAMALRNAGRRDYPFCKLLDVLDIEFEEPKEASSIPGLNVQQRQVLNNKKIKEADCLREMAVLLENQGLINDALFAINRALFWRPGGPAIQAIKQRLEKKLHLQQVVYATHKELS